MPSVVSYVHCTIYDNDAPFLHPPGLSHGLYTVRVCTCMCGGCLLLALAIGVGEAVGVQSF